MNDKHKLATCGLCCDLCDANKPKIQDAAKYLLKVFEDPMFLGVILMTNPEFKKENFLPFKEVLESLPRYPQCPGCQGRKECVINQCASQKGLESCANCEFLDLRSAKCKAPIEAPKVPFMPPAPIFFNGITKRYQSWNIENLTSVSNIKDNEIDSKIKSLIQEGKTSRDFIDTSVNLFELEK